MKKIAKFEKVSYNQFKNDFMDSFPQYNEKEVEEIYKEIQDICQSYKSRKTE